MPVPDGAAEQGIVAGVAQVRAGDEQSGADVVLVESIEDGSGGFAVVAAGEDEGNALLRGVAADDGAVVEGLGEESQGDEEGGEHEGIISPQRHRDTEE